MFIGTQIISYNGNLYQLIRTFRDREGFPVDECKVFYNSDTILRKDGLMYICRLIPEAQVIEDHGEIQLVEKVQEESTTPEEGCL